MNTFWLKIAGVAIVAVIVIALIGKFTGGEPQPKKPEKGFYDQVREDKQKYLTEPEPVESQKQEQLSGQDKNQTAQTIRPAQPPQQPPKPPEPKTLYFKPLSEIDKVEAEKYLNVAVPGRSIGRLPTTGFGLMVQNCRRIIEKWPESWYAYRAQQMLIDMPERYHMRYKVTEQEKNLSRFYVQRPGTEPFTIKEER